MTHLIDQVVPEKLPLREVAYDVSYTDPDTAQGKSVSSREWQKKRAIASLEAASKLTEGENPSPSQAFQVMEAIPEWYPKPDGWSVLAARLEKAA